MLPIKKGFIALSMLMTISLSNAMIIDRESLSLPRSIENVSIIHENNSFTIEDQDGAHVLQAAQMAPELRNISTGKLAEMLTAGAYLKVNKTLNETYNIDIQQRLRGGGAFGAWLGAYLGYGAVTLVGHGLIHGVAALTGPGYGPVSTTLEKMFAIPIHKAACAAGIAVGMTGAVATGPV